MESILSFSPVIIGSKIVGNTGITKINSAKAYLCIGFFAGKRGDVVAYRNLFCYNIFGFFHSNCRNGESIWQFV